MNKHWVIHSCTSSLNQIIYMICVILVSAHKALIPAVCTMFSIQTSIHGINGVALEKKMRVFCICIRWIFSFKNFYWFGHIVHAAPQSFKIQFNIEKNYDFIKIDLFFHIWMNKINLSDVHFFGVKALRKNQQLSETVCETSGWEWNTIAQTILNFDLVFLDFAHLCGITDIVFSFPIFQSEIILGQNECAKFIFALNSRL